MLQPCKDSNKMARPLARQLLLSLPHCHQVLSVLGWSGGQNACAFPPAPAFLVCGSMLGRLRVAQES